MRIAGAAYTLGPRPALLRCTGLAYLDSPTRHRHGSASAKLFADAEREEQEEAKNPTKPSQADILLKKHENWDGEERLQDVVLRMLVDKCVPDHIVCSSNIEPRAYFIEVQTITDRPNPERG